MRQARTMKLALVDQLRPPIGITSIPKITRCLNPERAHLRNVPKLGNATPERSAVAKRNSGTFRRHRTPFCGSATPFCGRQRFYGTFRSCETKLRNVPKLPNPTPERSVVGIADSGKKNNVNAYCEYYDDYWWQRLRTHAQSASRTSHVLMVQHHSWQGVAPGQASLLTRKHSWPNIKPGSK